MLAFGSRGRVLLIPTLDVGDTGDGAIWAGGGISQDSGNPPEAEGGAGAARTGTTFDGSSITFCGIGLDISKPRKLSRLILAALIL